MTDHRKAAGGRPSGGSAASRELAAFARPTSSVTAWSEANVLIESGGDHITAFVKLITDAVEPIACHTSVRSLMKPCTPAAWLPNPTVDARARIGRLSALRYEGLEALFDVPYPQPPRRRMIR